LINFYLKKFVLSSIDSCIKINVNNFNYDLFDFEGDVYKTKEEAQKGTIDNFPNEDPIELLGFNINTEFIFNYSSSKAFIKNVSITEEYF